MTHRLVSIFLLSAAVPSVQAQPLYPVVAKADQKARDADRRLILQTELAAEREALANAKSRSNAVGPNEQASAVHRHEENIKALERELEGSAAQSGTEAIPHPVVKALRPAARTADASRVPQFWDPYNRATDFNASLINQRSESHE
ncbi:hypothetical protein [Massilia orientalis]|uniref:Uncharacterized protein n=1 Tax=Massilia orientalis TaxID=3050128 RepID=A0ACC7MJU5_9BURK|nr:hypothetical protein [Massilia sp. YIM B02787]